VGVLGRRRWYIELSVGEFTQIVDQGCPGGIEPLPILRLLLHPKRRQYTEKISFFDVIPGHGPIVALGFGPPGRVNGAASWPHFVFLGGQGIDGLLPQRSGVPPQPIEPFYVLYLIVERFCHWHRDPQKGEAIQPWSEIMTISRMCPDRREPAELVSVVSARVDQWIATA
jgi:hypothetical protein